MPKPMLIIQTGNKPQAITGIETFDVIFMHMADYRGIKTIVRHVMTEPLPEAPFEFSGIIVTGSEAMVTDRAPWSERCAAWLKTAIESDIPVLGVCFGHQLIAQAFGGLVDNHPQGLELGTHDVHLTPRADGYALFAGINTSFKANMAHTQTVLVPPPQAVCVAFSDHDLHQILMYGQKTATFQFHPEFNGSLMKTYVDATTGPGSDMGSIIKWGLPLQDTPVAAWLLQKFIDSAISDRNGIY